MLRDLVLESSTAPGTAVTINLAGAQPDRVTFASKFASGSPCFYFMDDGTQAEWGIGVSTTASPNTLSRNTVIGNTAGTLLRLNFTGSTLVYCEVPGENNAYLDGAGNLTNTLGVAPLFNQEATVNALGTLGQFRAITGSYGVGLRNDGSNASLVQTASGTPAGGYAGQIPISWNLLTGAVHIDASSDGTTFGGPITMTADKITGLLAGTASGEAVHFGQFAQSLGAAGYMTFPGGLIIAWGNATTNGAGAVTVGLPFGSNCFAVWATVTGPTGTPTPYSIIIQSAPTRLAFGAASVNNTGGGSFQGAVSFFWIALGD